MARIMTKEGLERRIKTNQNRISQLEEDLKYIEENDINVEDNNEEFKSE